MSRGEPHEICPVAELPPGERRIVDIAGDSIGVFNVDGEFHALKNVCPHHLAPLCEGTIGGTLSPTDSVGEYNWEKGGEIIRCPWHKWEFDITTGESVYNPHRIRTQTYKTSIESPSTAEEDQSAPPQEGTASEPTTETDDDDLPACEKDVQRCDAELSGESPPITTYDTGIRDDVVVVYI